MGAGVTTNFLEYLTGPDFTVGVLSSGETAYVQDSQPTEDVHVTVKVSVVKIIPEAYLDLEKVHSEIDKRGLPDLNTETISNYGLTPYFSADGWSTHHPTTLTLNFGSQTVKYDTFTDRTLTVDSLKNPTSLTLKSGSTTVTYDGSAAKTFTLDALKNPNALTLKLGSTTVVYDGSSAKIFEIPDGSEVSY